jgi:hypothetical protein
MKKLLAASLLVLAGCQQAPTTLAPDFGNAVTSNMAAQVINPTPYTGPQYPNTDGKKIGDAVERYRTGNVIPPQPPIESVVQEGKAPVDVNVHSSGGG